MFIINLTKIAIIGIAMALVAQNAGAQTVISAIPYVITSSGNYVLEKGLTLSVSQGNGITINANDVIIDMNGFAITKHQIGNTPHCFGIYALNRANITVKNGIIFGFYEGIRFDFSGGANINSNHLVDGVRFINEQAFGIVLTQTTNCLIQNCSMASTGFDTAGDVVSGFGAGIDLAVNAGAANALINNRMTKSLQAGIETKNGQALGGTYLEGNLSSKSAIGFDLSPNDKYRNNTTISCALPFNANGAIDLGGNN